MIFILFWQIQLYAISKCLRKYINYQNYGWKKAALTQHYNMKIIIRHQLINELAYILSLGFIRVILVFK